MTESRRNPEIARIYQAIEEDVKAGLVAVLRNAAARGEIPADLDFERIVIVLLAIGDGIEWRRAVDPSFDAETVLPLILQMVKSLLTPASSAMPGELP
jgi:hypothetical protein